MKRTTLALASVLMGFGLSATGCTVDAAEDTGTTGAAITHGQLDGDAHPYVGLSLYANFTPEGYLELLWRCSGTAISPTQYLTAGHCTYDGGMVPDVAIIWFDADQQAVLDGLRNGMLIGNYVIGTPRPHPSYADFAGFPNTNDVALVDLWWPVSLPRYGSVAPVGTLDAYLAGSAAGKSLEGVGYGLQEVGNPVTPDRAEWIRMEATSKVAKNQAGANTSGFNVMTVDTPRALPSSLYEDETRIPPAAGGTCFGDSGGPQLLPGTDTVVAVTSFGLNSKCKGLGFHYRVDTASSQAFLFP
jgi:secreted trypsin-like serine protease